MPEAPFDVVTREQIKAEGYAAGLASPRGITCPYDGRTKAGRAWWDGFLAGDTERCCAAAQKGRA